MGLVSGRNWMELSLRSALRSSLIKRGGRSPSRKTVSFSSRRDDGHKQISNVSDCWQLMQGGTQLVKLRSNVRQFRRLFSLDSDLSHIRWTPTNKKPHKARISIDSIREVRVGRNTELLRASETALNDLQEECTFSIIYGEEYECLDLVAETADDANIWVTGLIALTSNKLEKPTTCNLSMLRERWLEGLFDEQDKKKSGFVGEKEVMRAITDVNPRLQSTRIKHKLKEMSEPPDENGHRLLTKENFVELYKEIATRPEMYFLMVRYANKDYLSCQDLRLFLETEQGMVGVTTDLCEGLIEQFEPCPEARDHNVLTIDGFTAYLLSSDCGLFDSSRSVVWQDMRQPLSRYFIASSHRSYLIEEQQGSTSVDGIVASLKRAARWIELEIWDPEDGEDEPQIQRGPASPNKIGLRCALETMKEYAFERSRYPLFLRLFLHCSIHWQKVIAKLLREKLAKRLYIPSNDPTDWRNAKPCPADFQMKIIIVCKRLTSPVADVGEVSDEDDGLQQSTRGRSRKAQLCKELSELSAPFLAPKPCQDLMSTAPNSHSMNPSIHLPLLSESVCLRLMHTYPAEFAQTTRDYVVAVTPNISRLDSSNLNPQEFWNHGCQIVGLNYQTPGLMMDLQEGRFSENGGCGYVLKPEILNDSLFVPGDKMPTAPQILHLRILSGQQLPRPRGSSAKGDSADPFVVIEIFGVAADCAEDRTKTVRNESMNPTFDESFQFQISVPELALVRLLVLDDEYIEDDFIGQYTIPFECLQPGYHHVPLHNSEGDPLEKTSLFVHIAVTNKRGGGKAKKRGMSVKRKEQRISTGMKAVGMKRVDDLFKSATQPLSTCIAMRLKLETCMVEWQEECGLGPTGSMRQGLRLIHSRMTTLALNSSPPSTPNGDTPSSEAPSFFIDVDDKELPCVIVMGQLPEQLSKTFHKLRALMAVCGEIAEHSDTLLAKMEEATQKLSSCYERLSLLCNENGLRGQKAVRASENFIWNLRVLKGQLSLLNRTQDEASDVLSQVFETARVLSILSDRLQAQSKQRRFSRVLADPLHDSVL